MSKVSGGAVSIGWALAFALCLLAGCPREAAQQDGQPGDNAVAHHDAAAEPADAAAPVADSAADGRDVIEVRPDYPEIFTTTFVSARHPGETGKLSELDITVDLTQNEKALGSEDITATASDATPAVRFDLPEYRIEITPLIEPPIQLDKQHYGSYGGYRVTLFNPGLEKMGVFEIDKKAELSRADSMNGHNLRVLLAAPEEILYTYAIYPGGDEAEPLLAVDLEIDGFTPGETTDAGGAFYEYRFPALTVTVHNKRLAREMKLSRGTNQQAISHDPLGGFWVPAR